MVYVSNLLSVFVAWTRSPSTVLVLLLLSVLLTRNYLMAAGI